MTSNAPTAAIADRLHHEACERDELRTPPSPQGLEVVQVTADADRPSSSYYLDMPSWTPDSKAFMFKRAATADGSKQQGVWLCHVDHGFAIEPIVEFDAVEHMAEGVDFHQASYGCAMAPDGSAIFHLRRTGDKVEAIRIDLATRQQQVVCTAPAPLRMRGVMSVSADSQRICVGVFLGDGKTEGAPWGGLILDVKHGRSHTIEFGNGFRNMHCQYSKDPSPPHCHDLMLGGIQPKLSDGSWLTPPDGAWRWRDMPAPIDRKGGGQFVVRDDGSNWRIVPVGRDEHMILGGHGSWRGRSGQIVMQMYETPPGRWRAPILEATPIPFAGEDEMWLGMHHPNAAWNDLTRYLARADSCHFGFDAAGVSMVSDTDGYNTPEYSFLWTGTRHEPDNEPAYLTAKYLLMPRTNWKTGQDAHPHAYLSPDGKYVVFQSDFTGHPEVHVAYNF